MSRINLLPNWMLPDSIPSVYDTQSGSFQEMVAKVYGAMRELQLDYKSFVNEINKSITEFTESTDQDQEKFKEDITKIIHDYIHLIDEKIKMQDLVIDDAKNYMKDNIISTSREVITKAIDDGEINVSSNYENETLYLMVTDNGGVN